MIYKYRKVVTDFTTYVIKEDRGGNNTDENEGAVDEIRNITELCTLDGETYIHAVDSLPTFSEQLTVEQVTLTDELKTQIKNASPRVRFIRERVVDKIREKYNINDELKIMSLYFINPEDPIIKECSDYKEACRAWGRAEKAKIGL